MRRVESLRDCGERITSLLDKVGGVGDACLDPFAYDSEPEVQMPPRRTRTVNAATVAELVVDAVHSAGGRADLLQILRHLSVSTRCPFTLNAAWAALAALESERRLERVLAVGDRPETVTYVFELTDASDNRRCGRTALRLVNEAEKALEYRRAKVLPDNVSPSDSLQADYGKRLYLVDADPAQELATFGVPLPGHTIR